MLPRLRRQDAHQRLEQRGLAHAVAAHDRDDLVRLRARSDRPWMTSLWP